jgi:urease accessory protein
MIKRVSLTALASLAATVPALAHLDPVAHGSFAAGFTHPIFGLDHILAMVAVGLWAALLGGRSVLLVPAGFVFAMLAGFGLALADVGLPFVEPVILASVIVLGLLVAVAVRLPAAAGAGLVGAFALFHGHGHGSEMGMAGTFAYAAGFALATALLHAGGVMSGYLATRLPMGAGGIRILGAGTALAGVALAVAG